MKLKSSYFYTLRENVKDEDSISGNLLVRGGYIKKVSSGVYMFLPLGLKVLENIRKNPIHDYFKVTADHKKTKINLIWYFANMA